MRIPPRAAHGHADCGLERAPNPASRCHSIPWLRISLLGRWGRRPARGPRPNAQPEQAAHGADRARHDHGRVPAVAQAHQRRDDRGQQPDAVPAGVQDRTRQPAVSRLQYRGGRPEGPFAQPQRAQRQCEAPHHRLRVKSWSISWSTSHGLKVAGPLTVSLPGPPGPCGAAGATRATRRARGPALSPAEKSPALAHLASAGPSESAEGGRPGYFFWVVKSWSISASVNLSLPWLASMTRAVPLGVTHTRWLPSRNTSLTSGCLSSSRK